MQLLGKYIKLSETDVPNPKKSQADRKKGRHFLFFICYRFFKMKKKGDGAILFVAANEPADITHYEPDDFEYICHKKTIELRKELCLIDKVDDALVAIEPFNNEIKTVYISVQVTDDIGSPEIDKITDYIGSCFEGLDKSQLIVSYIDPLCNLICNYEY